MQAFFDSEEIELFIALDLPPPDAARISGRPVSVSESLPPGSGVGHACGVCGGSGPGGEECNDKGLCMRVEGLMLVGVIKDIKDADTTNCNLDLELAVDTTGVETRLERTAYMYVAVARRRPEVFMNAPAELNTAIGCLRKTSFGQTFVSTHTRREGQSAVLFYPDDLGELRDYAKSVLVVNEFGRLVEKEEHHKLLVVRGFDADAFRLLTGLSISTLDGDH